MGRFWNIADFCGYDDNRLDPEAVTDELGRLEDVRADFEAEGDRLPAEEASQLAELIRFRHAVEQVTGETFGKAVMVPAKMFLNYVRGAAVEEHGLDEVGDGLVEFVDWEGWAERRRSTQFKKEVLDDETVWVLVC